jgi:NADH-quinone oxidoreductase subunit H
MNVGVLRFLIAATVVLLITVPIAFLIIFFEMKIIAFVNLRIGPNRIGPWGTLSSVIHGLKVLAKEDTPPPARTCRCSRWRPRLSTWPR